MTHEDEGNYTAKHPPGTKLDQQLAAQIREKAAEGKISCAAVHKIAAQMNTPAAEVGVAADLMEVRISKCQLGLYGYSPEKRIVRPAEQVSPDLEQAIRGGMQDNHLTCSAAWAIALQLGIPKMNVSAACETLGIKIRSCQLGAFK